MTDTVKAYLLAMLERALKTAAQTFLAATIGTASLGEVDWKLVGSTVALATILSVVTSLASISLSKPAGPAAFGPEKIED
jgi:hypothetical protein